MDCIFCKIAQGELESDFLFEDENVFVIKDINPKAKVHLLVIPKQHLITFNDVTAEHQAMMGSIGVAISTVTRELDIDTSGYKVISNNGSHGGQVVPHLHLHILGGESVKGVT